MSPQHYAPFGEGRDAVSAVAAAENGLSQVVRDVRTSKLLTAQRAAVAAVEVARRAPGTIDLDSVGTALAATMAGKTNKGWWKGEDGESDGTRSPMSRPTSRASSRGSPPSSRPASSGDIVISARPDSRESVGRGSMEESLIGRGGSGDVSTRSNVSSSSATSKGSSSKHASGTGKKKRKKKRKVPKRGTVLTEQEQEAMANAAAIRLQKAFRGFRARWWVVHPKLHSAGMVVARNLERKQGWNYYLREWLATDVAVQLFEVTRKLTIDDLEWAALVFQKAWRGRYAPSSTAVASQRYGGNAGVGLCIQALVHHKERPCWIAVPHTPHISHSEHERDMIITNRCAAMVRRAVCWFLARKPPAFSL